MPPLVRAVARRLRLSSGLRRRVERIERESHGSRATYVGDNRVLVKAIVGGCNLAFYVEADDRLISPWFIITGAFETAITDFFLRELRPDSHCIDIGANFGWYTCLMARFCPAGRVIGVEPDAHVHRLARDNTMINGLHPIATVVQAAASGSDADVTLHRRIGRSGNTSIVAVGRDLTDYLGEPPAQPFTARGVTIDALAAQLDGRVDFIKIDVEGAEPRVLAGARETIRANRDITIVMEWSPGQIHHGGCAVADFVADLQAMDLDARGLEADRLTPLSFAALLASPYRPAIVLRRRDRQPRRPGR